jgi:hypothetical protein
MQPISYARHQFLAEIIRHAVWLYLRFTLSYRDVEELLAERGIETSFETVRRWVMRFGPAFARNLRRLRPKPTATWHLDGRCHVGDHGRNGTHAEPFHAAGPAASRHAWTVSARKSRCVRAETRLRGTVKTL